MGKKNLEKAISWVTVIQLLLLELRLESTPLGCLPRAAGEFCHVKIPDVNIILIIPMDAVLRMRLHV